MKKAMDDERVKAVERGPRNGLQRHVTETDVLIVGGGPAGLSAAYTCQTLRLRHFLVEGSDELGGQLSWTHSTIHGLLFSDAEAPADIRQRLVNAVAEKRCHIETSAKAKQVLVEENQISVVVNGKHGSRRIACHRLIVATGARARRLGIPGEHLPQVYGASFSVTRHAAMFEGKVVAVVGGGDRALEGALYAARAGAQVMLIHRGETFRARHEFRDAVQQQPGVSVMLNTNVASISGSASEVQQTVGGMTGTVRLRLVNYKEDLHFDQTVDVVVLRIGMTPDTDLLRGLVRLEADGTVSTDRFLHTTCPGIYAIGDTATPPWSTSLAAAVSHGALAVRHIAQTLDN